MFAAPISTGMNYPVQFKNAIVDMWEGHMTNNNDQFLEAKRRWLSLM